jgi:hypothetical protein
MGALHRENKGGDRVAGPVNREPAARLGRGWNPCLSGQWRMSIYGPYKVP